MSSSCSESSSFPFSAVTVAAPLLRVFHPPSLPPSTQCRYVPANDQVLQRLQQNAGSPVTWFRQPYASLVLISCEDADAYKLNFRLQLRAMVDPEVRSPLAAEPVFVYVRPPALDPQSKGPGRALDAMRRELGSRRRERIVRIDPPYQPDGGASGNFALEGLDELIAALREAVRTTLSARAAAYDMEVRRHLSFSAS